MTRFLDREDVLIVGTAACGFELIVGDEGLLLAAIARPQATVFGEDAYPETVDKAAALMHSLATNHPLVDGNKRTAWASAVTFLMLNGYDSIDAAALDNDAAEQFVLDVATGHHSWEKVRDGLLRFVSPA